MSESAVKPAMPPEEWAAQLKRTPEQRRERLLWAKDEADADGYLDIHGLAALCLYEKPYGFTAEDVEMLRLLAGNHTIDFARLPDWAESLRARIAALLPPAAPG